MPGNSPNWTEGYIPPASEWNLWWSNKADFITGGVSSIIGNAGAVTLAELVTGGVAPIVSPAFTGSASVTSNVTTGVLNITAHPVLSTSATAVVNINESFSGTVTATSLPGWNEIGISGDSVAFPNAAGTSALFVAEECGGSTMTGNRNAVNAFLDVLSTTGNSATGANWFYTALAGFAETSANDGGTALIPYGNLFGGNTSAQLNSGATYWGSCIGFESDAGSAAGSLVQDLVGIQSIMLGTSGEAATRTSASYIVGMQESGTATGWQIGLQFGSAYSWWPIIAGGTLIGAAPSSLGGPAMACGYGINFSNVAFTTAAILSPGFEVDPVGNVSAHTVGSLLGMTVGTTLTIAGVPVTGVGVSGNWGVGGTLSTTGVSTFGNAIGVFGGTTQNVSSTAVALEAFKYSGSVVGSITTNGTSVGYNTTSDYRIKTTFGIADSGVLIDAVPVHDAVYNAIPDVRRPMFLAHELQAAAPWAVTGAKDAVDADGAPVLQHVDHSALVPILWAEIVSLRSRMALLEKSAA